MLDRCQCDDLLHQLFARGVSWLVRGPGYHLHPLTSHPSSHFVRPFANTSFESSFTQQLTRVNSCACSVLVMHVWAQPAESAPEIAPLPAARGRPHSREPRGPDQRLASLLELRSAPRSPSSLLCFPCRSPSAADIPPPSTERPSLVGGGSSSMQGWSRPRGGSRRRRT